MVTHSPTRVNACQFVLTGHGVLPKIAVISKGGARMGRVPLEQAAFRVFPGRRRSGDIGIQGVPAPLMSAEIF
jgi:hypothetical protein